MKRAAAIIQLIIVSSLVVYMTVNLFLGRFEEAFVIFPFLIFYYVYVVARQRRQSSREEGGRDGEEDV